MHASFFTTLAFTGLVASAIASPVETSTKLDQPGEVNATGYGFKLEYQYKEAPDYTYQGSILEQALGQIGGHISIVNNLLGSVKGPLGPGDALSLVGQIVPTLAALTGVLDNLPIVGRGSPYLPSRTKAALEDKGYYSSDYKGGSKCNKLCIFDLVSKIVLQVHGVVFSVVSKCGLGFSFQYLAPLVLTLIKSITSLDRVVDGVLDPVQTTLNQILGKCGFSGLLGLLGGN